MAFSGLHVACGHFDVKDGAALIGTLQWSQTLAVTSVATTSQAASEPGNKPAQFDGAFLAFRLAASVDTWVSWGAGAPDPTQTTGTRAAGNARILVRAGTTEVIFCKNGDLLSAIAA